MPLCAVSVRETCRQSDTPVKTGSKVLASQTENRGSQWRIEAVPTLISFLVVSVLNVCQNVGVSCNHSQVLKATRPGRGLWSSAWEDW